VVLALAATAIAVPPAAAQEELEVTIETSLGGTETFWLQIPAGYTPGKACPLLIGWHQWGGDHDEMRLATDFDVEANARGWIAASHDGPSPTHWNNHAAQSNVVDMIAWIAARYSVDPDRIYMVGASMGGAAGMVFANNHLDPDGPMVAAAASISGIQDCERRFREQGINNSMIAAFGGRPEEVPHAYRRNSAVCFADSTASMHVNALHLPLLLTFGRGETDQPWRAHAEDLYAIMAGYADTVMVRESSLYGHGWGCAETDLICDFLGSCTLDRYPERIEVLADEEARWYWTAVTMRQPVESFARFRGTVSATIRHADIEMASNAAAATLDLAAAGLPPSAGAFTCRWEIGDGEPAALAFRDVVAAPALVLRDGAPYTAWTHDPGLGLLTIDGYGAALYAIHFAGTAVPPGGPPGGAAAAGLGLTVWSAASSSFAARFTLPVAMWVDLAVHDAAGRLVERLLDEVRGPGTHLVAWDGRLAAGRVAPSGCYFLRLTAEGRGQSAAGEAQRATARLVLVR
jgi:S-formylglutathione hydrolase FrmB